MHPPSLCGKIGEGGVFMRICKNCEEPMADLMLSVAYNRWAIALGEKENTKNLGHVKRAV